MQPTPAVSRASIVLSLASALVLLAAAPASAVPPAPVIGAPAETTAVFWVTNSTSASLTLQSYEGPVVAAPAAVVPPRTATSFTTNSLNAMNPANVFYNVTFGGRAYQVQISAWWAQPNRPAAQAQCYTGGAPLTCAVTYDPINSAVATIEVIGAPLASPVSYASARGPRNEDRARVGAR